MESVPKSCLEEVVRQDSMMSVIVALGYALKEKYGIDNALLVSGLAFAAYVLSTIPYITSDTTEKLTADGTYAKSEMENKWQSVF